MQYRSYRYVLRMNGIVYIILEEYNAYYEKGARDNSDLQNTELDLNGKIYKLAQTMIGLCYVI